MLCSRRSTEVSPPRTCHSSIFPSVLSSNRITYLIDRRTLLRQLLRHQRLAHADFAFGAVVASITIEQILMAVLPVTSAIAMQLS